MTYRYCLLCCVLIGCITQYKHDDVTKGNIFRDTGPLCREFIGPGEFPAQRPVTRSFDVFFDLRPNKRLSKQPWGWWFETPAWSLWRHCNEKASTLYVSLPWSPGSENQIDMRSTFVTGGKSGCRCDRIELNFLTTNDFVKSHLRLVMPFVRSRRFYWLS